MHRKHRNPLNEFGVGILIVAGVAVLNVARRTPLHTGNGIAGILIVADVAVLNVVHSQEQMPKTSDILNRV